MADASHLHPTPYTLHPTPYTLHPTPYTLHLTLYTLHLTPYTLQMESLILAAGLGTRLRPLTNDRPKALVEINGKTLLEINLKRVFDVGSSHCVVNIHHFGDMMLDYIKNLQGFPPISVSDEREILLDTGGAIKHAAKYFSGNEPILIHNVDVISRINLNALLHHHEESGNMVTLCVSDRDSKRKLLFNKEGNLVGRFEGECDEGLVPLAFSGITVISPTVLDLLPPDDHPYPIIDEYLKIAKDEKVGYFLHNAEDWIDVGTKEKLEKAKGYLL